MATGFHPGDYAVSGIEELRRKWGWLLALGVALIALGCIAIAFSVAATVASVLVIGVLLAIGGVLEVVYAFWQRRWSGFFIDLFVGLLYVAAGALLIAHPLFGAAALTLMIALFLVIDGVFRIAVALMYRYHNWGWLLLNGIIALVLGIMIWAQWPLSGLWVIGLFVGIELLFNGIWLATLALAARQFPVRAY